MAIRKLKNKKKNICIGKSKSKNKNVLTTGTIKKKKPRTLTSEGKYQLQKLRFRAWKSDVTVIDVFKKRGWHYVGEPLRNGQYDYPKSMFEARKQNKLTKKDCLIVGDDNDGAVFSGYSNRVVCSILPYSHEAEDKVEQQKMFKNQKWFPNCYTLPKETKQLKKDIKKSEEDTFWICKPINSHGGYGLKVYNGKSKEMKELFKRKCPFIVQKYVSNPYLMAGLYKFHVRCYMLISNISPLKAYLYKDGQVLFATIPFDLKKVGDDFNKYIHITNYKISNEKKNRKNMYANKPGIGIGTEWTTDEWFPFMEKNDPNWSTQRFWNDLKEMAKSISQGIVSSRFIQKGLKECHVENHYEVLGLDVMMNENYELSISEWNTQPGLENVPVRMDNGVLNPHNITSNAVNVGVINDVLTKLGIDSTKKYHGGWITLH